MPSYPKHVARWCVSKEVIGTGTTSTVLLATHAQLPALRAAIKVVSRSGLLLKADGDPNALHLADAVIHREVLLMKLAAHERVIRLYDFVGHGDLVYMVMEHAPCGTLFDLFRATPAFLPPPLVKHVFSQLIHAVAHIHSLRIVHRDIKLENVFLFGPDVKTLLSRATTTTTTTAYAPLHIKLGDFGLAHIDSAQRLSTVFHGSPHYQAPELWARVPHLARATDVWSAGVVLYALLCRRLPFEVAALEKAGKAFAPDRDAFSGSHGGGRGTGAAPIRTHAPPFTRPDDHNCKPSPNGNDSEHRGLELRYEHYRRTCARKGRPHMAYAVPACMPDVANRQLREMFAFDPETRPTAREVLGGAYLRDMDLSASVRGRELGTGVETGLNIDVTNRKRTRTMAIATATANVTTTPTTTPRPGRHMMDLFDIATLCIPPERHLSREAFCGSVLESRVRACLQVGRCERAGYAATDDCADDNDVDARDDNDAGGVVTRWARRLEAYAVDRESWEREVDVRVREEGERALRERAREKENEKTKEKKTWKAKLMMVDMNNLNMNLNLNWTTTTPGLMKKSKKLRASLSFCNLRGKAGLECKFAMVRAPAAAAVDGLSPVPVPPPPPPSRASPATSFVPPVLKRASVSFHNLFSALPLSPAPHAVPAAPTSVSGSPGLAPAYFVPPMLKRASVSLHNLIGKRSPEGHVRKPDCGAPASPPPLPPVQAGCADRTAVRMAATAARVGTCVPSSPAVTAVAVLPVPSSGSGLVPVSVAQTLQERREAVLRRAFELGLGTRELRVFADEAGRIVRDARERERGAEEGRGGGEGEDEDDAHLVVVAAAPGVVPDTDAGSARSEGWLAEATSGRLGVVGRDSRLGVGSRSGSDSAVGLSSSSSATTLVAAAVAAATEDNILRLQKTISPGHPRGVSVC